MTRPQDREKARFDSSSFELTQFGFKWGSVEVERSASDDKWGNVLCLRSRKQMMYVRVTPSGLIRPEEALRRKS